MLFAQLMTLVRHSALVLQSFPSVSQQRGSLGGRSVPTLGRSRLSFRARLTLGHVSRDPHDRNFPNDSPVELALRGSEPIIVRPKQRLGSEFSARR